MAAAALAINGSWGVRTCFSDAPPKAEEAHGWTNGHLLPARLYPKDHAQLDHGVVVEHKHLDRVFAWIAAQQRERDAVRLASPKISRREKQRICSGAPLRIPAASPT
jgi:hypothetical protein